MKTSRLFHGVALLAIGVLASCSQDEVVGGKEGRLSVPLVFTAGTPSTRTQLVNGTQVYWTKGDAISVMDEDMGKNYRFSTGGSGMLVTFEGEAPAVETYYAVYPYTEKAFYIPYYQTLSALALSADQQAVDGTFATGLNMSWATAKSGDMVFQFHNITALVKFSLSGKLLPGIETITLTGNRGEALAYGEFEWSLKDDALGARTASPSSTITLHAPEGGFKTDVNYYFTIVPGVDVFQKGLVVMCNDKDGHALMTKSSDKAIEVKSGKILNIGSIEVNGEPEDGYEVVDGTWWVYNAKGLKAWAEQANEGKTYLDVRLVNDIDLTGVEWEPVGNIDNPYLGTFDGNGKTITGLKLNSSVHYVGFFGALAKGSEVKGLTFKNAEAMATDDASYCGILAGSCCGSVTGVNLDGAKVGGYAIGGLIGSLGYGSTNGGTLEDARITGKLELDGRVGQEKSDKTAGGAVGSAVYYSTRIRNVTVEADFTFTGASEHTFERVGLLVGYMHLSDVENCHVVLVNDVQVNTCNLGGIVGEMEQVCGITASSISAKQNWADLASLFADEVYHTVGGVVGKCRYNNTVSGCYVAGVRLVSNSGRYNTMAGIVADLDEMGTVNSCYFNGMISKKENSLENRLGAIVSKKTNPATFIECYWYSPTAGLKDTYDGNEAEISEASPEYWVNYAENMNNELAKLNVGKAYEYVENTLGNKENVPLVIRKKVVEE